MSPIRPKELRELSRLWSRWVDIVGEAAKNSRRVKKGSSQEYADLHASLLRETEVTLQEDDERRFRQLILRMKAECRPWVSLESFSTAEKHVLLGVLDRSLDMRRQLSAGAELACKVLKTTLRVVVLGAAVWLLYLLFATPLYEEIQVQGYRALYRLRASNLLVWLAAIVAIVVVSGVLLLKSTREY